ncbi:MAG: MFS transporter [Anaerolineae bacterium]|nr:MFS transporter [Anaerolineae bacterium]
MQTESKPNLGWVTAIAFLCLFLLGLIDNLKGATLPPLLAELSLSDAQGGSILLWAYLGFLTAALLVGVLSDLAGNRAVVLASAACLVLGIIGYSLSSRLGLLSASMALMGMGLGGVDMAGSLIIVAYYTRNKGRLLNLMSFFHGLSSTLAPYYAGLLLTAGLSWRQVYQFPLVAVAAMLLMGALAPFPKAQVTQKSGLDFHALGKVILQPGMGWFFALMILYVSTEIGVASWLVTYLQRIQNLSVTQSALFLSMFFVGVMIGRLLGTLFVERIGYLRAILITSSCAALCLAVGMFGPGASYWALPLTGLFLSIIFPTLTAAVSDRVSENVGTVMGLLFAFCGIGGAIGPWLIGLVSDAAGIQAGFAVNLVTCTALAAGMAILMRIVRSNR